MQSAGLPGAAGGGRAGRFGSQLTSWDKLGYP